MVQGKNVFVTFEQVVNLMLLRDCLLNESVLKSRAT